MLDELSEELTKFYYDIDTYNFKDIYSSYEIALNDTKEALLNKKLCNNILLDLKDIKKDICIDLICNCNKLIILLNEYINSFNEINKNI